MDVRDVYAPWNLRGLTLPNRVGLPPMSTYSAGLDAAPTGWHRAHYLAQAAGPGLVIVEATAVSPGGRVTRADLGLWSDAHTAAFAGLAADLAEQGTVPGLQLSHAGRKASRTRPWEQDRPLPAAEGGWELLAPSALPFADGYPIPHPATAAQIQQVVEAFANAAGRAHQAGFRFLELHAGHGRLLHSFLSPLSNHRTDGYGGAYTGRTRLLRETVTAVRAHWPDPLPLAVRLSAVDHQDGGWSLADSVRLAGDLARLGVDLIDCTSGGIRRPEPRSTGPGHQVPYARAIRAGAPVATAAVGLITTLADAAALTASGAADLVLMGRALLRDPRMLWRARPELAAPPYRRALATARTGVDPEL